MAKIDLSKASDDSLKEIALGELTGGLSEEKISDVAIHAYRALARRGEAGHVRFFVELLGELRGTFLEKFLEEEFLWVLERLGEESVPEALALLSASELPEIDRAILAEGLEGMAGKGTLSKEIHKAFAEHLQALRPERQLNGSLIATLITQDPDIHHEAILAAYEANVVDVSVNGDRESVEIDLGLRSERETKGRDIFALEEELHLQYRRTQLGPFPKNGGAIERASYFIDLYCHPSGVTGISMLDGLYAVIACSPRMVRPAALVHLPWDYEKASPENSVTWEN